MMRLVEQGKVGLAAPARRYLPDLKLADEAAAASVTVRQLLAESDARRTGFRRKADSIPMIADSR